MSLEKQKPNFYEVGKEYYWRGLDGKSSPVMTVVLADAVEMIDLESARPFNAQMTSTVRQFKGHSFPVFAREGELIPVERSSGEEKIFAQFKNF